MTGKLDIRNLRPPSRANFLLRVIRKLDVHRQADQDNEINIAQHIVLAGRHPSGAEPFNLPEVGFGTST
jgi:hypothetical protein